MRKWGHSHLEWGLRLRLSSHFCVSCGHLRLQHWPSLAHLVHPRNWSTRCSGRGSCHTWDPPHDRCNSSYDSNSFCNCNPSWRPQPSSVSAFHEPLEPPLYHRWGSLSTDRHLACKRTQLWDTRSRANDSDLPYNCISDFTLLNHQRLQELWDWGIVNDWPYPQQQLDLIRLV